MLHGGDIYGNSNVIEMKRSGEFLDFSINTNPLGMPEAVKAAIREHIDDFEQYPDPHCRLLRAALSRTERVGEDQICCGNGAADLIFRLCLARRPKQALVCAPTFSEYERAVTLADGTVQIYLLREHDGFALTERFLEALHPQLDMVFLCNPNNPTGRLIETALLEQIIRFCRTFEILLVLDECFIPFTRARSLSANEWPGIVVLKALTKTFSLAGLRIGYILSYDKALIKTVADTGQYWAVSTPAQVAALSALECLPWLEQSVALIEEERPFLTEQLRGLGLRVFDSDANFLLFQSKYALLNKLLAKGILIRDCDSFTGLGAHYYRCCVKQRAQNERLLAALKEVLHG
ncbi:pyridoxal phosphate-dependent aminotransferase [Breznakiellaceae bacterium SP9]